MIMIVVVALALVATVAAAPVQTESPQIIRTEFNQQPDGSFSSDFETENGIKQQETGELRKVVDEENKEHLVIVVRGSYAYIAPDGHEETINYIADENGYQADGPSVPKFPAAARR